MLRKLILAGAGAAALTIGVGVGAGTTAGPGDLGQTRGDADQMTAREEFHQTYRISRDGTVRVRGIAGPVTVQTTDGGDTAEVHILRMAATERELRCYRTEVSSSGGDLSIEHVQLRERGCDSIRSRQEVRLTVPRSVDLDFSTVAGAVDIAPTDGRVRLDSIAGATTLASVREADIDAIAGSLSIGLAPGNQDVRISSVVGPVEVSIGEGVNTDLSFDSVIGSVRSLAPGIAIRENDGSYRARAGSGGGRVSLSAVVGAVRLRRP